MKSRLLGHWGTTPGLNSIYAHMNRVIRERDVDAIFIAGPGHGGPGVVANTYLEGTYSEVYPTISRDVDGLKRFVTQFSFPGGIPSHVAAETQGRSTRAESLASGRWKWRQPVRDPSHPG